MNPVFRLALVVYSKLLNNLDENSITEKDVNTTQYQIYITINIQIIQSQIFLIVLY